MTDMPKTRLEILCELHEQQGGTIHQFNKMYGIDFISLDEIQWVNIKAAIQSMIRYDAESVKEYLNQSKGE